MALFYDCWKTRRSTIDHLQRLLEDAHENADRERRAAVDIQRLFRGQFVRTTITLKTKAEIIIARVYRGHLARVRCHNLRYREQLYHHRCRLHYYATVIQKRVRGAQSRHRILDFRVRKAYVKEIARKGDEMRRLMEENLARQQAEEQRAIQEAAECELVQVTQNLHHLVGTRAISGIYSSPMLASTATSFGIPVETHIRNNTKTLIASQFAATKPPTKLIPYPPSNKATIQASSVYGADLKAIRTQKKYHKLRRLSASDFQLVHNPDRDAYKKLNEPGINTGVEYLDGWRNPYKKRGVPRSKEDLLPTLTTLEKAPKKPFHLTYGGNKSKVHANDRFDV